MKPIHWIILVSLICGCVGNLRAQSCCDTDNIITVCYLSAADYCTTDSMSVCTNYSLDGEYMEKSLKEKLLNADNFGFEGVSECQIEIKRLPRNPSLPTIKNTGCDIIFVPAVSVDPITDNIDGSQTFIPPFIFDNILDWSVECPGNLVIASQGEATEWGYKLKGRFDTNPNTPENNSSLSKIFNNPFGDVGDFFQDGSFQFVFSDINISSNAEVLARDESGEPSIILDIETNDLLFADIGIFCGDVGGVVTDGPLITNSNDILVANVFALGCPTISEQTLELCNNSVALPDNSIARDTGTFIHNLSSSIGCDSIIQTKVILCEEALMPNMFSPNGDSQNNYFNLITDDDIIIESFQIFNRWGQMVYNNETPLTGWDGTYNDEMAPVDVYIYRIIYTNSVGTRREIETGDVTLMR